jgi:hypothetical protein
LGDAAASSTRGNPSAAEPGRTLNSGFSKTGITGGVQLFNFITGGYQSIGRFLTPGTGQAVVERSVPSIPIFFMIYNYWNNIEYIWFWPDHCSNISRPEPRHRRAILWGQPVLSQQKGEK